MNAGASDREEDRQLAAEYALGLLTRAEAASFEARMVAEPDLRAAYALWAESFAAMTDGIEATDPPSHVYTALEAQLFGGERPARRSLSRWLGLGALLGAAAVMLLLWLGPPLGLIRAPGFTPDMTARLVADGGTLVVAAGYDSDDRVLEIAREVGAPQAGRSFELWLISGDNPPVSLGLLPETQRGLITVPEALAQKMAGATLAISDEPEGGSPTGQATGPVIAVGPLITAS
ncbi:anti-sigma factor domain-containing protein [Aquicoccus sp. G2-2]|uniref:anti-sigma factor n=1 Tax=Aquicoccus sp. G2-2 TaxID=3092120 RepID=UPI002AE0AEF5|nr:anti-sigma factor [Aquicoccus sp. G2-2]MEA1113571.1 anti-sigma factor [Aquicoccus sp. G2-2]